LAYTSLLVGAELSLSRVGGYKLVLILAGPLYKKKIKKIDFLKGNADFFKGLYKKLA
jgi:hypothetical protein